MALSRNGAEPEQTCEVEHLLELFPVHEDVGVQEGVAADVAGELLHGPHRRHGVVPVWVRLDGLVLYS